MSTPSDSDSQQKALPVTPGSIVLVRHGEPALSRKIRLNSAEYRAWWARYEEGGIREGQVPPPGLIDTACQADVIFASTRLRAVQTAAAVCGAKKVTPDPLLIEAPLPPPPLPAFIRLNPRTSGFLTRVTWWFFNRHEDQESRAEAEARAAQVAERLIARAGAGEKVLVLAHGFFNTMVGIELKRRGWAQVEGRGHRYWTAKRFEWR